MLPNWALFLSPAGWSIDIEAFNPLAVVLLLAPLFVLRRRGKSAGYLLCFSLFFFYMWAVFAYAICPLPIDAELLDNLRRDNRWDNRINLVPGAFLRHFAFNDEQNYGNFVLGVPFGFGLPFVVASTPKRVLGLGFGLAAGLELAQLGISVLVYRFPYRSIDIDDVLRIFAGSVCGYGALRAVAWAYRRLGWARGARLPVWDHMHAVLLATRSAHATMELRPDA